MKVRIGDTTYDDIQHPIMLILTPQDKRNILHMPQGSNKYISCPGELTKETQENLAAWANSNAVNQ
jgi:hypothetical protein